MTDVDLDATALSASFPPVPGKVPRHFGYIVNFSYHVWYL